MLSSILILAIVIASTSEVLVSSQSLSSDIQVALKHNGKLLGVGIIIERDFLIAPWSILESKPQNEIKIVVKASDGNSSSYAVKDIRHHFEYDSSKSGAPNHNVALIRIDNGGFDFVKQPYLDVVPMVEQGYEPSNDLSIEVRSLDSDSKPVIEYATIFDHEQCRDVYGGKNVVNDGDVCANLENDGICKEDLGTAMLNFENGTFVAFASWEGNNCKNRTYFPAVFTSIGAHRQWIDTWIKEMRKQDELIKRGAWRKFEDWVEGNNQEQNCKLTTYDGPADEWIHPTDCKVGCVEIGAGVGDCETYNTCMCQDENKKRRYYYDVKQGFWALPL